MTDYAVARFNMVEGQVRPNKVTDPRIVDAMMAIPRELFVPKAQRSAAYVDEDVPIGDGRFLMEPMIAARLISEARIDPKDIVLDVGCGPGYSTAVAARLANMVVALESDDDLARMATSNLAEIGADNILVVEGALSEGHPAQAPYDVILFSGAVAEVPPLVISQLAEGGRLVAVVRPDGGVGRATLIRKLAGATSSRVLFDAQTPYLPGLEPKPAFVF